MPRRTLQITFIDGRPLAAHLTLDAAPAPGSCASSREIAPGLVVDLSSSGTPLGIEITAPSAVTLEDMNRVLVVLGQRWVLPQDAGPMFPA
ncbi:MAG: DUF2283 domain-containing protein [Planctomycetes bacterium]|nr:DUF2283 domain-containing protein [Planctomycetota bacterium]